MSYVIGDDLVMNQAQNEKAQSAINCGKIEVELRISEEKKKAIVEKLQPLIGQISELITAAFDAGFETGFSCRRLKKEH